MIIIDFFKDIKVSKYTYIIVLLALITGQIKELLGLLIIIISHEYGHYFMSKIFKWNIDKIYLYPFGGLIKYNEKIDKPFKEELLIAISGILNQFLVYLLFLLLNKYYFISDYFFNIIKNYNYSIILFNLIPIIPLDGSKILNIILNKLFNFRKSYIILNIILFLIYKIYLNIKNKEFIFNRFILEKYLYPDDYKDIYIINNIKDMKRNKKHIINNMF